MSYVLMYCLGCVRALCGCINSRPKSNSIHGILIYGILIHGKYQPPSALVLYNVT